MDGIIAKSIERLKPMNLHLTRARQYSLLIALTALLTLFITPCAIGQQKSPELPKGKQTSLGLYLTATEAYQKWLADPENVRVLDVRTTEEYIFIGHAPMARNVPLNSQTYQWDAEKQHFAMKQNPEFINQVMEFAKPSDTILVTCRSGGRSAMAVNLLAEAGFTDVYNITDGMEGDVVDESGSVFQGQRFKNGWKNSGNPWTYKLDPELMRFARNETEEQPR
jgi:rhodanese-related sulfurtransferase